MLSALTSRPGDTLVLGLTVLAFAGFFASLATARAHEQADDAARER